MPHPHRFLVPAVAIALVLVSCTEDDPAGTPVDSGNVDTSSDAGSDVGVDTSSDSGTDTTPTHCEPLASDYAPAADDTWPECISDDDTYHRIEESVSTIGRVAGFEEIADLLWRDATPTAEDFVAARDVYATGEGLDSRVQRREDEHYPPVTDPETGDVLQCRDEGVPELDPERCVGPALILPVLNDAFQQGILGNDPEVNAARVEAALLWFLYVSSFKEATTCAEVPKDCDSAWAYYTGGEPRQSGLGLSAYVRALAPETHDRVWDGILAVRCWRDLDPAEQATDLETQALALAQMDRALLHGVARIVIDRIETWRATSGAERDAAAAFVAILGPVLDREATERDAGVGADVAAAWADLGAVDVDRLIAGIETLFPCP